MRSALNSFLPEKGPLLGPEVARRAGARGAMATTPCTSSLFADESAGLARFARNRVSA
jgi:hypothetical protein